MCTVLLFWTYFYGLKLEFILQRLFFHYEMLFMLYENLVALRCGVVVSTIAQLH